MSDDTAKRIWEPEHPGVVMARGHRDLPAEFVASVVSDIRAQRRIRMDLPTWGRLYVDRQLPFLCVYRQPTGRWDNGTGRLIMNEASFLIAPGDPRQGRSTSLLVREVATTLADIFGEFLLVEVWSGPDEGFECRRESPEEDGRPVPQFQIHTADDPRSLSWVTLTLQTSLERISVDDEQARVEVLCNRRPRPPGLAPLLGPKDSRERGVKLVGVAVRPVYREARDGRSFPKVLHMFRSGFSLALRRAEFAFARSHTTQNPPHFHTLGRRAVGKATWKVDHALAEVDRGFNWLFQVTPINSARAWREFKRSKYAVEPRFVFRPLRVDPFLLRRTLFSIPVERITDPALDAVFRQKAVELSRLLSLCGLVGTPGFLHESIQVFGEVSDDELRLAQRILEHARPERSPQAQPSLDAEDIRRLAGREYEHYAHQSGLEFPDPVISDEFPPGCIVNQGRLYIGAETRVSPRTANAFIQHEVGTHALTYFNGREQPLSLLSVGLAGYEETQEGLAVLSEYLVGGLDRSRLRAIAARVLAVRRVIERVPFSKAWAELRDGHRIPGKVAFMICMRAYRGGGLTKDAIYLRGLTRMLELLGRGRPLNPFWIGKIHFDHLPIIEELLRREVLRPPLLSPRILEAPEAAARLERLRRGVTAPDLLGEVT